MNKKRTPIWKEEHDFFTNTSSAYPIMAFDCCRERNMKRTSQRICSTKSTEFDYKVLPYFTTLSWRCLGWHNSFHEAIKFNSNN